MGKEGTNDMLIHNCWLNDDNDTFPREIMQNKTAFIVHPKEKREAEEEGEILITKVDDDGTF